MPWSRAVILLAAVALGAAPASPDPGSAAAPCTHFVGGPGSNDRNPGTSAGTAWASIRHGVAHLRAGDRLCIRGGTYAEALDGIWSGTSGPRGTSWSNAVTIASYPGEQVVIQPPVGAHHVLRVAGAAGDVALDSDPSSPCYLARCHPDAPQYIVFDGLVFDGTNLQDNYAISLEWSERNYSRVTVDRVADGANGPHHIRFVNLELRYSPRGIHLTPGADYNEFLDALVHHNGYLSQEPGSRAYYISGKKNKVVGGSIHHNDGIGLQIWSDDVYDYTTPADNLVQGVTVYSNGANPWARHASRHRGGFGGIFVRGNRNTVDRCTVYDHQRAGVELNYGGHGNRVTGNYVHHSQSRIGVNPPEPVGGIAIEGSPSSMHNDPSDPDAAAHPTLGAVSDTTVADNHLVGNRGGNTLQGQILNTARNTLLQRNVSAPPR